MKLKKLKKSGSIPMILIFGILFGLLTACVMILFSAFLMTKNDISPEFVRYFWVIIYFLCGTVSGLTAGRISKSKGFLWGFITALISALILIIFSAVILKFNIGIFAAILIPVCAVSGALSGIIAANLR